MHRVRSCVTAVRNRVTSRGSRTAGGGMKLGRTRPCSMSWAIHTESATSVLRPGTLCMCCALSSQHSTPNSGSSIANTGFQYTPVASIPTNVTACSPTSQSAIRVSPAMVVANVRVSPRRVPRRLPGTRTVATTLSRCTSSPAQRSTRTSTPISLLRSTHATVREGPADQKSLR
jgi:hypothetical protein